MTNFQLIINLEFEFEFLMSFIKEKIIEIFRHHTYDEEFDQCKKVSNIDIATNPNNYTIFSS